MGLIWGLLELIVQHAAAGSTCDIMRCRAGLRRGVPHLPGQRHECGVCFCLGLLMDGQKVSLLIRGPWQDVADLLGRHAMTVSPAARVAHFRKPHPAAQAWRIALLTAAAMLPGTQAGFYALVESRSCEGMASCTRRLTYLTSFANQFLLPSGLSRRANKARVSLQISTRAPTLRVKSELTPAAPLLTACPVRRAACRRAVRACCRKFLQRT